MGPLTQEMLVDVRVQVGLEPLFRINNYSSDRLERLNIPSYVVGVNTIT